MTKTPRPRDPSKRLPPVLPNLDNTPAEFHWQYAPDGVPDWDGSFPLQWIEEDDHVSKLAYNNEIGAGDIHVMPRGETLESLAARKARQEEMNAETLREVARLEEEEKATRLKAVEARQREAQKRFDAEAERIRQSYGR
jgi:hypothetical protein